MRIIQQTNLQTYGVRDIAHVRILIRRNCSRHVGPRPTYNMLGISRKNNHDEGVICIARNLTDCLVHDIILVVVGHGGYITCDGNV